MFRQELDRQRATEPRVASKIDLAHASATQLAEDLEPAELNAGPQLHGDGIVSTCCALCVPRGGERSAVDGAVVTAIELGRRTRVCAARDLVADE